MKKNTVESSAGKNESLPKKPTMLPMELPRITPRIIEMGPPTKVTRKVSNIAARSLFQKPAYWCVGI